MIVEIDDKNPSKIRISQTEWKDTEVLKALPTAHFERNTLEWTYNLSWQMWLALQTEFGQAMRLGPKLVEWLNHEYLNRIKPAMDMREVVDAEGYERLFPHQRGAVKFLSTIERGILADGLGSGKSQSAFSTVRALFEHKGVNPFPVLVVCPNSTKYAWEREIEEVWPGLKVNVIDGNVTKRRKIFKEKAHVTIVNWESVRTHSRLAPFGSIALKKCPEHGGMDEKVTPAKCEVHNKELNEIDFVTVIADEAHRMKDPASKVARATKAATGDARFRFALTGTPIASAPDDLFSILNWLFPHAYPSKSKYLDRFCQTHYDAWGSTIVSGIKPSAEKEFFGGLDPFLRRMPKEIILPFLPPVLRSRRDVEMGAKQQKAYAQMRDQMLAELDDGTILNATSPLTKMTRLLQFASAYAEVEYRDVYNAQLREVEHKPVVTLSDPSCTLDAFMEDLPDYGEDSIVVFAVSKQLINLLSARMDKAKIPHGLITGDQDALERQKHMDDFQAGRTKYILCTIAAGGTGITLTKGRIAVFLQRSWSNIENTQAEGRVHRIGSQQHESVQIIDYVTTGTSQEVVFKAVEEKGRQLEFILRDKALMEKYLKAEEITAEEVEQIINPEETKEEESE